MRVVIVIVVTIAGHAIIRITPDAVFAWMNKIRVRNRLTVDNNVLAIS